jgi:hypothetical protein
MPRVEFEPANPVFEWAKTIHALHRAGTVSGLISNLLFKNINNKETVYSMDIMNCIVVEDNSCHIFSKYTPHRKVFPLEFIDSKNMQYAKQIYLNVWKTHLEHFFMRSDLNSLWVTGRDTKKIEILPANFNIDTPLQM